MEKNEIVVNEEVMEVMEVADEVVTDKSGKVAKVCVGIGLTALVGGIVYKYVVKPLVAKAKAKKDESVQLTGNYDDDDYDSEDGRVIIEDVVEEENE